MTQRKGDASSVSKTAAIVTEKGLSTKNRQAIREMLLARTNLNDRNAKYALNNTIKKIPQRVIWAYLAERVQLDDDIQVRLAAAEMLLERGEADPTAIAFVCANLDGSDFLLQCRLLGELSNIASMPDAVVASVKRLVRSNNLIVRFLAAVALAGRFSQVEDHNPIVGIILNAFDDDDFARRVYEAQVTGLRLRRPYDERVLKDSSRALADFLSVTGMAALVRARADRADSIVRIEAELRHTDDARVIAAIMMLRTIGAESRPTLPAVIEAMASPAASERRILEATELIRLLGPTETLLRPLARVLRHAIRRRYWLAAEGLGQVIGSVGPFDASMVRKMVEQLGDSDPDAREMAAVALAFMGPPFDVNVAALIDQARVETDLGVWTRIGEALATIGPEVIPTMVAIVEHGDIRVMNVAAEVLSTLAVDSAEPLAALLLETKNSLVRRYAARLLGFWGPKATIAVPSAMRLYREGDLDARFDATIVLHAMGANAVEAAPLLCEAAVCDDLEIRTQAYHALLNMGAGAIPALQEAVYSAKGDDKKLFIELMEKLGYLAKIRRGPDFSWVSNQSWLKLFVAVAEIIEGGGKASANALSEELKRRIEDGRLAPEITTTPRLILIWMRDLGIAFSEREKKKIELLASAGARKAPKGLSEFGKKILPEIRKYLETSHDT